jgi:hypothetical protein
MDGVVLTYILTTIAALLVAGWVKYSDWRAVQRHHHTR